MKDKKKVCGNSIVKMITEVGMKNGMDLSRAFSDMLDSFIDFLSIDRLTDNFVDPNKVLESIKDDKWYGTYIMWLAWVRVRQKTEGAIDAFDFYEDAVKSKGKATALGQFYTPMSLCNMMSEMLYQEEKDVSVVNDSAVGSGRTMLGYANVLLRKKSREVAYYIANDIDEQSVKMCALNFCVNAMFGRVLCADGLTLNYYWGYEINESLYPFPAPVSTMSIRKLPKSKGSSDPKERQNECNAYMTLDSERRKTLEALYALRNGNIDPCMELVMIDDPYIVENIATQLRGEADRMQEVYKK